MRLKIAPSILSAYFERLGEQVKTVERAGADQIHVDVMDGHFVPNLSMGPVVVEALRRSTRLPLDVHLMITDPEKYLESFIESGANHITFHIEASGDPARLAAKLHDRGVGAGLALNPETSVDRILEFIPLFDLMLVMTVHPGFGGQSFLGENLEKVKAIRERERLLRRDGEGIDIEVDGGIDLSTARLSREAGANVFVAGNAIFRARDAAEAVRSMKQVLDEGALLKRSASGAS